MDRTVRVWNVTTGKEVHPPLKGHTNWVRGVAFSPEGTRIASSGYDNTVRIWSARSGEPVLPPLTGHTSLVVSVAFSPDGRRLASGSQDRTVKVWDADTGQEVLTLKGHPDEVQSLAFTPDGTRLVSASQDGTVLFWDARPWTPAAALEREALALLGYLFAKPLCKDDVFQYLRTSPIITPESRRLALSFIERYREETNPERYHQASWAILRQPYLNAFQYRFALRQAETACRLAPKNGQYRTALGVARYRAGQYKEALAILNRADQRDSVTPVVLAFLAMVQHRLALRDQARTTLVRLRQIVQKPEWVTNTDARMFVVEAEALLATNRRDTQAGAQ
jgi:hypothetical protein